MLLPWKPILWDKVPWQWVHIYPMGEHCYGTFEIKYGNNPQENKKMYLALIFVIPFMDFASLSLYYHLIKCHNQVVSCLYSLQHPAKYLSHNGHRANVCGMEYLWSPCWQININTRFRFLIIYFGNSTRLSLFCFSLGWQSLVILYPQHHDYYLSGCIYGTGTNGN